MSMCLATRTPLPIIRVLEDIEVKPDHIYLMSEGKFMLIEDGTLRLVPREPEQSYRRNWRRR